MKKFKVLFVLTLLLTLCGCSHYRLVNMLESQGEFLNSFERPNGDEIYIVRSPDGEIIKYRVYPIKQVPWQIEPDWRYERLLLYNPKMNMCQKGVVGIKIDCEMIKDDPYLGPYIKTGRQ